MENRPRGRQQNITGQGKDIRKTGSGLGTGPVGDTTGRPSVQKPVNNGSSGGRSGSRVVRGGGMGLGGIIIVLIIFFLTRGFGGADVDVTDTGSNSAVLPGYTQNTSGADSGTTTTNSGNSSSGSMMSDALSQSLGSLNSGSVSTGWARTANTGKLDTSVASGSRAKYTNIVGGGKDKVTIMVYMCGTDLESKYGMATNDLSEMANAKISDQVNLIVLTGGCRQWKNSIVSAQKNQIYKVEQGGLVQLSADYGTSAMTSPANLSSFIKYCAENYKADRYDLILWDHGGGSLSGYGYDEKNARSGSMTLKGINTALKDGGVKFDFVGFDACLMATLETGIMLNDYADYLIASEETEPGVGWYYTNWLTKLSENTSMSTLEIGKNIVDDFVATCARECAGQKTTLSVIDLAELSNTVPANLRSFATATTSLIENNGYATVSNARTSSREFASSSRIDQIDLVHLCYNLDSGEAQKLASSILGAVKYNKTSPDMTNAYGLSIYFPYQKASSVSSAVQTYDAIGFESEYSECIRKFASLEAGGQAAAGGASSPLNSLLGSVNSSAVSSDEISGLLSGILGDASSLGGRSLDIDAASQYLAENRFDASALDWNSDDVIALDDDQWALINRLELNVFYDDGEGYIDLGLDNVYSFTDEGWLKKEYSGTWLAINDQPIPYYHVDTVDDGEHYAITGRVPVMLNGERADLILVFTDENPKGYIAGVRSDYRDGETETIAKGASGLENGDVIQFVCDYYSYSGVYQDSYLLDGAITVDGDLTISDVYINADNARATYRFTDIYGEAYWTSPV